MRPAPHSHSGATPLPSKKPARDIDFSGVGKILMVFTFIVATVLAVQWVYQSWPIKNIELRGKFHYWSENDIARHLTWLKGESFFSSDLQRVANDIEQLPLMSVREVRKIFPDTISLQLEEDGPIATWNDQKVLTRRGVLVNKPDFLKVDGLISVYGDAIYSDLVTQSYRSLNQVLSQHHLFINQAHVSETGSLNFTLSNQWQVFMGSHHLDKRAERLSQLINIITQPDLIKALDLRYDRGASIQWHDQEGLI